MNCSCVGEPHTARNLDDSAASAGAVRVDDDLADGRALAILSPQPPSRRLRLRWRRGGKTTLCPVKH